MSGRWGSPTRSPGLRAASASLSPLRAGVCIRAAAYVCLCACACVCIRAAVCGEGRGAEWLCSWMMEQEHIKAGSVGGGGRRKEEKEKEGEKERWREERVLINNLT